jgi:peptidyl-tRNA hydrolase
MVVDYVLSKFKPNEKDLINEVEDQIFDLIFEFIKEK